MSIQRPLAQWFRWCSVLLSEPCWAAEPLVGLLSYPSLPAIFFLSTTTLQAPDFCFLCPWMPLSVMLWLKGTYEGKGEEQGLDSSSKDTTLDDCGRLRGLDCRVEAAGMILGAQILSCRKQWGKLGWQE